MKKFAVLTAVVFLFGVAGFAAAEFGGSYGGKSDDPSVQAQTGGTAVSDSIASGNTLNTEVEVEVDKNVDVTKAQGNGGAASNDGNATNIKTEDSFNKKTEDSFNYEKKTEDSYNTKVQGNGGQAANNGSTNVNQEAFLIKNELPGSGDSADSHNTTDSHALTTNTGTGSTGNESIGSGSGGAIYQQEDANYQEAGAQYKSNNTNVKADADDGSIAINNAAAAVTLDKSTHIDIKNIGLALQKSELSGKVEDNKLIVGGPEAVSVTKGGSADSGKAYSGKAESGEAESGEAVSVAKSKSKSGSGAFAGATSGSKPSYDGGVPVRSFGRGDDGEGAGASADADSDSKSKSAATSGAASSGAASSGAAASGAATSGSAAGGAATSAAVKATTNFTTGNNNFTTSSFNGIGVYNINSGVGNLGQSSVNVNAVVGGSAFGN